LPFLILAVAAPSLAQEGGGALGAPRHVEPTEPVTPTTEPTEPATEPTEPTEPTNETAQPNAPEAAETPFGAPPPAGSLAVPPGYGSAQVEPAPYQDPYAQPQYDLSYVPPRAAAPRRTRVRYQEGMPIPPHAQLVERRLSFLMWPGLGVFAASYALSAALTINSDTAISVVPFLGPILWQVREGSSADLEVTVPLSILQLVGAVAFVIGVQKRRYLEQWTVNGQPVPNPSATRGREIALLPTLHRHGGGISLMVR
jgi:hypothetical protein